MVAFLQPFCGFQHILEGPEVNCGDLECDLEHDLGGEMKIRRQLEMVIRVEEDKEGKTDDNCSDLGKIGDDE